MRVAPYSVLMAAGILLSLVVWWFKAPRTRGVGWIYFSALVGAFTGAKLVYLLAEGWLHWNSPDRWIYFATGKTILGALLGGYAGVEIAKRAIAYRGATGDWFATATPFGIIIGRIGCLMHGCCAGAVCQRAWYSLDDASGTSRWPAVPTEILFNIFAIAGFFILRRRGALPGQHFHLYLIGYGTFRFAHEFVRDTPKVLGPFSGYQLAAFAVIGLGAVRFVQRAQALSAAVSVNAPLRRPASSLF